MPSITPTATMGWGQNSVLHCLQTTTSPVASSTPALLSAMGGRHCTFHGGLSPSTTFADGAP